MKSTTEITVRSYHIDQFGHVNHARYLELLEEARWRYLEDQDLLERLHQVGLLHVVAEINIKYRKGARIGDILQIETEIDSRRNKSFVIKQNVFIKASGKTAVEASVTNVFVDEGGQPRMIDRDLLNLWPDLAGATGSLK